MRVLLMSVALFTSIAHAENLIAHGDQLFACKIDVSGSAKLGPLGDAHRDAITRGVILDAANPAAEVAVTADHLDARQGRWFRFAVTALPQSNFSVDADSLYLKAAFFGADGTTRYDAKDRRIFDLIRASRKDLTVNGARGQHGAEVWQTYLLDFYLPFPQVDSVKLSVGFDHGSAKGSGDSSLLISALSLMRLATPAGATTAPTITPLANVTEKDLLSLGGRWFYLPKSGETAAPKTFGTANADRLLYHDDVFSAPFSSNTSAWLRAGDMDRQGNLVTADRLIEDNLTIELDSTSMILHTHDVPNHATGRFPEQGFGNPSHIAEQDLTYYLPLTPKLNPRALVTSKDNSNRALHMGPIGIAVNGVVFFNPFDMGNTDATNLMDRCCGHPNQDGTYHYHKYPICVNSPWSDPGASHSPLIGFAFDGLPLYGPYESTDVMAKDLKGAEALNGFNAHFDKARGWHYHVTPAQFPYLIGGFFATEDLRDNQRPKRRGDGNGGPPGRRDGPPPGFGDNRPPIEPPQ